MFYAPTYRSLEAAIKQDPLPYNELLRSRPKPKLKGKAVNPDPDQGPSKRPRFDQEVDEGAEEFAREQEWWDTLRLRHQNFHEEKKRREVETARALKAGEGLPCGCCFDDYVWVG